MVKRDTNAFRERFNRWKNGELVYDKGRPITEFSPGKDTDTPTAPTLSVKRGDKVDTDLCAAWSNAWLRDNGYLTHGNAWNLKGVDVLYNGYAGMEKPAKYDRDTIEQYNHAAADSVYKNFDSKTLDKSKVYAVNMYYNGSRAQEEAYNNGLGVTGTHTGLLSFSDLINRWQVSHNIHGTIHQEPFVDLQHGVKGKGKYGVTAIYLPREATTVNKIKDLFGFQGGKEEDNNATTLREVVVNGYAPMRLTTYYPVVSKYPFTGHSELDIPVDRDTWEQYTGEEKLSDTFNDLMPYVTIDKRGRSSDYNLVTNNCADATLGFLNSAFTTKEQPLLFTTPGDVRKYAIKKLNGKVVTNSDGSDTVLIPRNENNYKQLSKAALDWYTSAPNWTGHYSYKASFKKPKLINGKYARRGFEDGKDDEIVTNYSIPFIKSKAVRLTNAGLATGARLSTNLLDSIADNAERAGLQLKTAIGLAAKENTLGNPTDDRSMRTLLSPQNRYALRNAGYGQHINTGVSIDGNELVNYYTTDYNDEFVDPTGPRGKSVLQKAFEFYRETPWKYNPGLKNHPKLVDKRGEEVMLSPEVQKWLIEREYAKEREIRGRGPEYIASWFTSFLNGKDSGIHIKPSHRGRLTALKKRTGKSEAELYRTGGPAVRKMITFARNARKWNHN